jgi:hypothetical protein
MTNIAFVGDVHGQLLKMYAALVDWMYRTETRIDAVVQVGDLGVFESTDWGTMWKHKTPVPIPTWAIMGNHEDPNMIRAWQAEPERIPGMHLMADGAITDVLGVKIGGVWGNFSPRSWATPEVVVFHRNTGASPRIAAHINSRAVRDLLATGDQEMDVLVTHDSARCTIPLRFAGRPIDPTVKEILGLRQSENPKGCPAFDELLAHFEPSHYFFGHLHYFEEGQKGPTATTCLHALGMNENWMKLVQFDTGNNIERKGNHENQSLPGRQLVAA